MTKPKNPNGASLLSSLVLRHCFALRTSDFVISRSHGRTTTIANLRIAILALVVATCGSLLAASPGVSDAELHKILRTRVDLQKKATGIVIGVIDREGRRVVSFGTMSLEKKRPVDGKTIFEIGSVTKIFTALLLGRHGAAAARSRSMIRLRNIFRRMFISPRSMAAR